MAHLQKPSVAWHELKAKLREARVIWFALGGVVILWLVIQNFGAFFGVVELKDRVRWYGIFLEIGSITTIALELNNALLEAGRAPIFATFFCWLAEVRFIFIQRPTRNASAIAALNGVSAAAAAGTTTMSSTTLEERVAHLEEVMGAAQANLGLVSQKVDANADEFRTLLHREATGRTQGLSALRENLERQTLGDIRVQVASLVVLVLSIFFANAPDEMAVVFTKIGLGGFGHRL